MNGVARRAGILERLVEADAPVAGATLAREMGVSRQVIVQDVALLRGQGARIISTNRGYLLEADKRPRRLFKVRHSSDEAERELTTIVDLGGTVEDVLINHRTYGTMSARLDIASRRDVEAYLEDLESSRSSMLLNVTSGYHFHHISADSDEELDAIGHALDDLGFLVEPSPYERETMH